MIEQLSDRRLKPRWRFEGGQAFCYQITHSHYRRDGSTGSETVELWCRVTKVEMDGTAQIGGTILEWVVRETGDVEYELISSRDSGDNDPLRILLSSSIGRTFAMTIRPNGEVTRVRGFRRVLWSMLQSVKGVPFPGLSLPFLRALADTYNDAAMRRRIQDALGLFPERGVSGQARLPGGTEARIQDRQEVELVVPEEGRCRIQRESDYSFDPRSGLLVSRREKRVLKLPEGEMMEVIEAKLLSSAAPGRIRLSALAPLQRRAV